MYVACIGSRKRTPKQLDDYRAVGAYLVQCGHYITSGNALETDQAFAEGGNSIDPTHVCLYLPWKTYEHQAIVEGNRVAVVDDLSQEDLEWYTELARAHHPAWHRLKQGGRKLMVRNGLIILPSREPVNLVLASPSPGGGGTAQGMKIAKAFDIEVIDLNTYSHDDMFSLCARLHRERVVTR